MGASDDMRRLLDADDPPFEEVMACVFDIQHREVRTYLALLDRPGSTVEELAAALDRDRSTVNRALAALLDRDLVERQRRLLDAGGYVYQYRASPLPETKARLHDGLDRWAARVHARIDAFEEHVGPDR